MLLVFGSSAEPANAAPHAQPATLVVVGEGSVTRAPDRLAITFRLETTDEAATQATSRNAAVLGALDARLTKLGVPPSAIVTTSFGLRYLQHPAQPRPDDTQRYGYTVERIVTVTVDRTDQAGALVDAGVAAGVSGVDGVAFELRDPRAAWRAAQAAALADGQSQARALAAAAHLRLVRLRSIAPPSEGAIVAPTPRFALAAVPTTIAPGPLSVAASLRLVYEVAP